jgi:drug/metabolite transporter (DMT)-like permease
VKRVKPASSSRFAVIALVAVAAVWGAAFVLMKPAINEQPFWDFLAVRFTIATLIMILVRPMALKRVSKKMLVRGAILGVFLGLAYVFQTINLELTTAAITGFLTGLYVVLTPIFARTLFKTRIRAQVWVGAFLALIGLALISITGFTFDLGHIWGILGAAFFAAHIVGLGRWSPGLDSYSLTIIQLASLTCVFWIGALQDGYQAPPNFDVWFAIVFTAVFATAIGFFVQTWAQSKMDASRVAVILTLEVVFTAIMSVAVGQETLLLKTVIGGAIIVVAMLVVEWPSRQKDPVAPIEPMVH